MKPPNKPLKPLKLEKSPVRSGLLAEDRRRSHRVMVRVPVILHVQGRQKELSLTGVTVAVSETGGMLLVSMPLEAGTKVILENPATQKRVGATVTRHSQPNPEGALVPVEFAEPAPAFWNIFFPPPGN